MVSEEDRFDVGGVWGDSGQVGEFCKSSAQDRSGWVGQRCTMRCLGNVVSKFGDASGEAARDFHTGRGTAHNRLRDGRGCGHAATRHGHVSTIAKAHGGVTARGRGGARNGN